MEKDADCSHDSESISRTRKTVTCKRHTNFKKCWKSNLGSSVLFWSVLVMDSNFCLIKANPNSLPVLYCLLSSRSLQNRQDKNKDNCGQGLSAGAQLFLAILFWASAWSCNFRPSAQLLCIIKKLILHKTFHRLCSVTPTSLHHQT